MKGSSRRAKRLATYSISGTITQNDWSGTPVSGATVNLSGAANGVTTTNSSGVYTFGGLANGSYTLTPSMRGYSFTPANRSMTVSGANVAGQDFKRN